MKRIVSILSVFLALTLTVSTVSAAEIIIGGSDTLSNYTVEHYLESHYSMGENLALTETLEGAVGRATTAEPKSFLGYTADSNILQEYITSDNNTTIAVNYTMDGFETGDINCDGYVDILDSTLLQRKIAGWVGYDHTKICLYTSDVNTDGDVGTLDTLMLMNALAGNKAEQSERVTVKLNNQGTITAYELVPGTALGYADDILTDDFKTYKFDGWYDSTFTKKYTVVPNESTTLYAKYKNYVKFSFENASYFDPLNLNRFSVVDNPSGDGKVLSGYVSNSVSNVNENAGTLRGFNPGIYEGVSSEGLKGVNGKTYSVSFKYRYEDTQKTVCTFSVYGSNASGLGTTGNKSGALTLISTSNANDAAIPLTTSWATFSATFKYTNDYPYFYFRFSGKKSQNNIIYIDDFVVTEIDTESILLNINGDVTHSELVVGDELPTLDGLEDPLTETVFEFKGWYDSTLTNLYTTVSADVNEYFAVFENYTVIKFTNTGIFDPSNRYTGTTTGKIACWRRAIDPTDSSNVCVRAYLSNNINNTHFPLSVYDGIDDGYKLQPNTTYLISFDYLVKSSGNAPENISGGSRGVSADNTGISGGKSTGFCDFNYSNTGKWEKATCFYTTDDTVTTYPYLILLAQASSVVPYPEVNLYMDNIVIRYFDSETTFKIATAANNITFNENGNKTNTNAMYVGKDMPDVPAYYGAEFINWYDEDMRTPYLTIPKGNTEFKAKYNADIINFSDGGYFDPNGNFGKSLSKFTKTQSPTDYKNNVLKIDFANDGNTHHFAVAKSGYNPTEGYKLTKGNTYEISFMYYAEKLSSNGVDIHFRGSTADGIGVAGNKTDSLGSKSLKTTGVWTGVTIKFTYNGDLSGDDYLIFLAQDACYSDGTADCESIIYFDNFVIKETEPATTYASKTIKFNGRRPGDTYRYLIIFTGTRKLNIVIPDNNFPYIARMQLDNLVSVYSKMTGQTPEIVKESKWRDSSDYHCNIFVGDVSGDTDSGTYKISSSSLSADDYAYKFGNCNVYINGGSTYALAMGISEFTNQLINSGSSVDFKPGESHSGKYSEKIDSYSTADYYRPTFMEDFTCSEINTDIWSIMDIGQYTANSVNPDKLSVRSKEHTYVEDGNLIINGAFDDKYYYGGMLRSHGKLEYKYGYFEVSCIIPNGGGLWTATWLTPTTSDGFYYGEIDVNESYGNAKNEGFNVHLWPTSAGRSWGGTSHTSVGYDSTASSGTFNDAYHTYGFLWTEDRLVATLDGEVKATYIFTDKDVKERYDSFSDYMSVIVSMTVGNTSIDASKNLDESGDYWNTTNKYIVDYVHIYQVDGQDIKFTSPVQ